MIDILIIEIDYKNYMRWINTIRWIDYDNNKGWG